MAGGMERKYVPLTVDNVTRELHGVDCIKDYVMEQYGLALWMGLPESKLYDIDRQHSTQDNQTRATVEYWLSVDPTPSWRKLLCALEWCGEYQAADRVKQYVEPLIDPSLTAENVSSVLQTVETGDVCDILGVSNYPARQGVIQSVPSTEPQRRQEAVDWFLQYSPNASWTWLAGQLFIYRWEERANSDPPSQNCNCEVKTALEPISQYIQKDTADSTLTPSNLLTALSAVKTRYRDWWGDFADCIQVPKSMKGGIPWTYDDTQRKTILLERWLREHPAPSWALVAEGLYAIGEHDVLAQVSSLLLTAVSLLLWGLNN